MFVAKRSSTPRLLSLGAVAAMVASATLVVVAPANAAEVYARPSNNTITLAGAGFGPGHGMSQWGAYGAATVGRLSWRSIVGFYYPGTRLRNLGNPSIRVRLDVVSHTSLTLLNRAGLQLGGHRLPAAIAGARVTAYRVHSRAAGGLQVDALSRAGWKHFVPTPSPAVFHNVSGLVDVLLANGTRRAYRGSIDAYRASLTAITVVSVLPMESYLRAVVPAEMPPSWHRNALAAQAVAARSYAGYERAHASAGQVWDTCDTTSCQMYSGFPAEQATSSAAVLATAGQTLTYAGRSAFTQFGAADGGFTSAGSQAYLVARADPYDGAIANGANAWTASISVARIQSRWPSIGTYRQLRIIRRNGHGRWGGRVLNAVIDGSKGSVAVSGATIRSAFGLRSDWFVPTNPAPHRPAR